MWWWWLALAFAGTKADARAALERGRFEEAAGLYRLELLRHPGRGWAERGLTAAARAHARQHLSDAERWVTEGQVGPGLDAADRAIAILERAAGEGAQVAPAEARAAREELVASAADREQARGRAALSAGRYREAVDALSSARALRPDDGQPLAEARRAWAAWLEARQAFVDAGEQLEASVALTGSADDRQEAARLYAAAGRQAQAAGDCVGALAPLRRATHLAPSWAEALQEAEQCARVEVVLEVRGAHVADATSALQERLARLLADVLAERGYGHVQVVSRADEPALTVRVGLLTAETVKGEVSSKRTRRPGPGPTTKIIQLQTLPVTTTWTGRLVVVRGDEVVHEAQLTDVARTTARWDGKVVAVESMGMKTRRDNPKRSGNKAPAVSQATTESEAAVARAFASTIATTLTEQLDATPRGPRLPTPEEGRP